jgi:hypothetical protein
VTRKNSFSTVSDDSSTEVINLKKDATINSDCDEEKKEEEDEDIEEIEID